MSGHAPDYTPVYQSVANRKTQRQSKEHLLWIDGVGLQQHAYGLFRAGNRSQLWSRESTPRSRCLHTKLHVLERCRKGGFLMTVIGVTTYARWTRRFKRVAEGLAMFLPVSYGLCFLHSLPSHLVCMPARSHGLIKVRMVTCCGCTSQSSLLQYRLLLCPSDHWFGFDDLVVVLFREDWTSC